jgi:hypothetical protein
MIDLHVQCSQKQVSVAASGSRLDIFDVIVDS